MAWNNSSKYGSQDKKRKQAGWRVKRGGGKKVAKKKEKSVEKMQPERARSLPTPTLRRIVCKKKKKMLSSLGNTQHTTHTHIYTLILLLLFWVILIHLQANTP
eukprot:TRINITY_DN3754_c0_g1_i1.p1 TRINITY_DN3754_c0_g1~~TRINITY_DN3754_c0_g1_i1.p1  ORF type:complete len:103 (-),score=2.64 TRINITY_DN3754_c0_g1_i1:178-486(-)